MRPLSRRARRAASPTRRSPSIEAILPPLSRVAEVRALRRTAISLLDAYVGHDAGERILAGRIRRGDTETIRAVIWLSDMRGFTALADRVPPQALIELLNRFYDCLVPPIEAEGGEVLKFMGDGLLAIFRIAMTAVAPRITLRPSCRQPEGVPAPQASALRPPHSLADPVHEGAL